MDTTLSDFYTRYSYVIAHGRNIVNVILVDFRAVDTFGEIAVVLTTGAAILALVRIRVSKKDRHGVKKKKRPDDVARQEQVDGEGEHDADHHGQRGFHQSTYLSSSERAIDEIEPTMTR